MKNILLVLIPSFTAYAGFIGTIVYESIKKPKYYWLKIVVFAVLIVSLFILDIPRYKDMIKKNTNTVIAEYVEFQTSSTLPCTRKAYFKEDTGRFYVYVPTFNRDIAKLEVGRIYEIEYFCNSRVIKEYRLIG